MRTLEFRVRGLRISYEPDDGPAPVAGSAGYLRAHFALGPDWRGMKIAASFYDERDVEHAVLLDRQRRCQVPDAVTGCRTFRVSLTGINGDAKIKTNTAKVHQEVAR